MTEYEGCSVVPPQLNRETGKPLALTKAEKLESLPFLKLQPPKIFRRFTFLA